MPDVPLRGAAGPPGSAGLGDDKTCPATLDGSRHRRCQREAGHGGLHRWQSRDRSQTFDWG